MVATLHLFKQDCVHLQKERKNLLAFFERVWCHQMLLVHWDFHHITTSSLQGVSQRNMFPKQSEHPQQQRLCVPAAPPASEKNPYCICREMRLNQGHLESLNHRSIKHSFIFQCITALYFRNFRTLWIVHFICFISLSYNVFLIALLVDVVMLNSHCGRNKGFLICSNVSILSCSTSCLDDLLLPVWQVSTGVSSLINLSSHFNAFLQ